MSPTPMTMPGKLRGPAEQQALAEVRAAAAEAAVAERILTETTKGKAAENLVAIRDVKAKLN